MSTISIHDLDQETEKMLREIAEEKGQSLNKTIKDILERKHGKKMRKGKNRARLIKFRGKWSKKEFETFSKSIKEFEQINPDDWK